ncbi:chemotaxis protein CheB [Thiocystis violascens]|uniref:protein-glutamate O-methyltransferase n=1 Tax=Thiocystis violascens (strain ATCC 17096 / DSM 198 / 6111) TaxID=765911 RepID=I3YBZ2_THIV6|nr:chemotaxis protein CheB [Thiocystis violascens]AFL74510.1 methylase of chemotaxis methyl-accepting protein [Thiocystis violascens DSM 198]
MDRKKTNNANPDSTSAPTQAADAPDAPLDASSAGVPNTDAAPEPDSEPAPEPPFPIVGIGASAGGLAAFEAFFSAIPTDLQTGMAFVLVQHLAPDHKSILTELVKRYTSMEVQEVVDGVAVRPDCAYIIPPNLDMALLNGKLHLLEPKAPRGLRLPIDFFFRSLAQDQGERAICVILSGTGSDGTLGARAIKGEGGMVMAQTPKSAAYDGMPRSVLATGLVDFELAPAEMPAKLMDFAAHAFGRKPRAPVSPRPRVVDALNKICILLRDRTSHDFSQYKQSTLERRIERRMALHRIDKQDDYLRYLQKDPTEVDALFQDLLVGVSCFFRDPEAFAVLERDVIPGLFANRPAGAPVRVWVCGCSTGEEAYSVAILLQEHLETLKKTYRVQIFATDLDARSIERARVGVYPASIAVDVSTERLARFFSQDAEDGVYRIQKVVRDLLVFSEQNLIKDPPFSRLDLISCRNLLIYLNSDLQKRLISLFHYALNPGGVLFLGSSETVGEALTSFAPLSRKWKLYVRQESSLSVPALAPSHFPPPLPGNARLPTPAPSGRSQAGSESRVLTERALLNHFNPVGILTNGRGEILYIHGRSGQYLEPAAGDAAMNILDMAREGLRRELTLSLQRAVARKESVHLPALRVKTNGDFTGVNLTVHPAQALDGDVLPDLYLVVLEPVPTPAVETRAAEDAGGGKPGGGARRIAELESELRAKEEYLQSTLEEMQTANEELKSTNEEMQSVNEELQSTNEELETSKEELQSVNEELATVNVELQDKVADLSRANNDMNNLLAGTGIATLFVDHQLRITRFTPATTQLIKLIQSDIGRPVGDIVSNFVDYDDLVRDARAVLKSLTPLEAEVRIRRGDWYLMRIGPYVTLDKIIEGAVITFMDISSRKRMEQGLEEARALAAGIVETVREPLIVLDGELRVVSANRAFHRDFQLSPAQSLGQTFWELGNGQWDLPALRTLLLELQSHGRGFEDYRVSATFAGLGQRTLLLNARRLDPVAGHAGAILLAIEDITERMRQSETVSVSEPAAPRPPGACDDS